LTGKHKRYTVTNVSKSYKQKTVILEGQIMKKVLSKLAALYLRLRVKDAHKLGVLDTTGKVTW
jgi:hypothetical protein